MKILFWGTADFAVPSLRALLGEDHEVVGVVTQPDRPAGRGRQVRASPVKLVAEEEQIPVLQPERATGDTFVRQVRALEPELNVVIAYGQILKKDLLELPPEGSINVHASLLPELRGAAPIAWAIMRGHTETGITVIRMNEQMDAGPILLQVTEPILDDERGSDLWTRLSEIGAAALVEALTLMEGGVHDEQQQDESRVTFAPRLTRDHAHVDWSKRAIEVDRQIRALDEVPGAWSALNGQNLQLFRPRPEPDNDTNAAPGTIITVHPHDDSDGMLVACGEGAIWVREVQPPGKRRMTTSAWARGRQELEGSQLL